MPIFPVGTLCPPLGGHKTGENGEIAIFTSFSAAAKSVLLLQKCPDMGQNRVGGTLGPFLGTYRSDLRKSDF